MKTIDINKLLKEVSFNFSRSGGKGGQNVNKVETKVELVFNVPGSLTIDDDTRKVLLQKLDNKLDKQGNIRITSQTERAQLGNRKKAIAKFADMINAALKKDNIRIKTVKTLSSRITRLEAKKKHSEKKKNRSVKNFDTE